MPTETPLGAAADTHIRGAAAAVDLNYGGITSFQIGEDNRATGDVYRGLIKFDLSTITSGATVSSASMVLTVLEDYASNARTWSAYRMTQAWVEGTKAGTGTPDGATWNTSDGATAWPGGSGALSDAEASAIGTCSYTSGETLGTAKTYNLDTTLLAAMCGASPSFANNGFLVKPATETNDAYNHASRTNATVGRRPLLTVTWTAPASGAIYMNPYAFAVRNIPPLGGFDGI